MVYWQDCKKVSLYNPGDNDSLKFVKEFDKSKGKGTPEKGEILMFIGEGGKVVE